MPVQAAMIGNRSGLIAIAPTISTELLLMTANAPTTPAAAISSGIARSTGPGSRLAEHIRPDECGTPRLLRHVRDPLESREHDVVRLWTPKGARGS